MTRSLYIEDIFLTFFALCIKHTQLLQSSDWNVCQSFEDKISSGYHLTENQGKFILKLLSKYKDASYKLGLDYNDTLTSPIWKNSFRS